MKTNTSWTGRASNGQTVVLWGISEAEVRYGGHKSAADQLVIPGYLGLKQCEKSEGIISSTKKKNGPSTGKEIFSFSEFVAWRQHMGFLPGSVNFIPGAPKAQPFNFDSIWWVISLTVSHFGVRFSMMPFQAIWGLCWYNFVFLFGMLNRWWYHFPLSPICHPLKPTPDAPPEADPVVTQHNFAEAFLGETWFFEATFFCWNYPPCN